MLPPTHQIQGVKATRGCCECLAAVISADILLISVDGAECPQSTDPQLYQDFCHCLRFLVGEGKALCPLISCQHLKGAVIRHVIGSSGQST